MAYAFDSSGSAALERVQGIEATWDAHTIGHLATIGPGEGGSFLEIGAGAGSIARWASHQVSASGEVLATDLDTRFLQDLPHGVTVLRHDIRTDPLPLDHYDLVHARLVLSHLPERDTVLATATAACRPGGRVLIEEFDESDTLGGAMHRPRANTAEAEEILLRAWPAMGDFVASLGYDAAYGHRLVDRLADCGLTDVTATRTVEVLHGASPQARAYRNSLAHLGLKMIERNLLSAGQLEPVLALLDDPGFSMATPVLVTAWGRRPDHPNPHTGPREPAAMPTSLTFTLGCTLLGLQTGAFLPTLVHRLGLAAPDADACPECLQTTGRPAWRVWLTTANRCDHCGRRLGPTALLLQLHTAAVFGLLAWRLGPTAALPAFLSLGTAGVALAAIDLRTRRLPDRLVLPSYPVGALLLGLAAATAGDVRPYLRALTAAAVLFASYAALALIGPRHGMGGGDVKLAGVLGMFLGWLGWREVLTGTVLTFGFAAAVATALLATRRATWSSSIPFGPFMLAGTLAATVLSR